MKPNSHVVVRFRGIVLDDMDEEKIKRHPMTRTLTLTAEHAGRDGMKRLTSSQGRTVILRNAREMIN